MVAVNDLGELRARQFTGDRPSGEIPNRTGLAVPEATVTGWLEPQPAAAVLST